MLNRKDAMAQPERRTGIPTEFDWRRYRSRLEARWAAFFSLLGWQFEYEPMDLSGWIPDFALFGAGGRLAALVEIKPYSMLEEFGERPKYERAIASQWPLDHSSETRFCASTERRPRLLLVGIRIFEAHEWFGAAIGWVSDEAHFGMDIDEAVLAVPGYDFAHTKGSYRHVLSRYYDGGRINGVPMGEAQRLWNKAGNMVQWKP